jgi:TonB family protein
MHLRCCILVIPLISLALASQIQINSQTPERAVRLAVLSFGDSPVGRLAAAKLARNLESQTDLVLLDHDQSRAAATGIGYAGSLNMSLQEARDLGAAMGCDYFIIGDAQTLRRSPSIGPIYFESYASIFLVSSHTGRLLRWERPAFQAATPEAAEKLLVHDLSGDDAHHRIVILVQRAHGDERTQRDQTVDSQTPLVDEALDDEKTAAAAGLRLPRPYRRSRPAYPESASSAEAEATVDVLVDIDPRGEVSRVELARWAGFGLDEATMETVRRLHFFPAMRSGAPISVRVLIRYNFRKPPK